MFYPLVYEIYVFTFAERRLVFGNFILFLERFGSWE